ncbi:MAG TPA: polysaccharide biosynthesis/export family protein, partial [Planctomycetota bacterium]|nr:polysaccharide biosynthesis/export family protein [Planctomycetota bacterium]
MAGWSVRGQWAVIGWMTGVYAAALLSGCLIALPIGAEDTTPAPDDFLAGDPALLPAPVPAPTPAVAVSPAPAIAATPKLAPKTPAPVKADVPAGTDATPAASVAEEYHVRVGDLLQVWVYGQPDLSQAVRVSPGGRIDFPFVG